MQVFKKKYICNIEKIHNSLLCITKRESIYVYIQLIYLIQQKLTQHCKATICQINK